MVTPEAAVSRSSLMGTVVTCPEESVTTQSWTVGSPQPPEPRRNSTESPDSRAVSLCSP